MDKISYRNPSKSKLNVQSHIIGKHIRDVSSSWIAGITLLPPNDLLLADWNNTCVKRVHADTSDITDYLQLSSDPWDITTLGNDQAAVTFHDEQKIQFISTISKLSLIHAIAVDGECRGICSTTDDDRVVSFIEPGKVEVLDTDGSVLSTIATGDSG